MERVDIVKDGVPYYCTTESQLASFLEDGWERVEKPSPKPIEEKKVTKTKK